MVVDRRARRAAVLSFMAKMEPAEIGHLVQLMVRGILPQSLLLEKAQQDPSEDQHQTHSQHLQKKKKQQQQQLPQSKDGSAITSKTFPSVAELLRSWYGTVESIIIDHLTPEHFTQVAWERQLGLLHVLEAAIRILGFGATAYVRLVYKVVVSMLAHAQQVREDSVAVTAAMTTAGGAAAATHQQQQQSITTTGSAEESDADEDIDVAAEEEEEEEEGAADIDNAEGSYDERDTLSAEEVEKRRDANQSSRVRTLCLLRIAGTT